MPFFLEINETQIPQAQNNGHWIAKKKCAISNKNKIGGTPVGMFRPTILSSENNKISITSSRVDQDVHGTPMPKGC